MTMNGQSSNTQLILNPDPIDGHAPLDEARIREELIAGAIVDVDPLDETIVDVLPMDEIVIHKAPSDTNIGSLAALLDNDVSEHLRTRWNEIQGRFVDEPRSAVQQADALVSEVVDKITQMFASERGSLEGQWKEGNDVSTEDLRKALQHYRSFFNRLVV
jgi:hypothetical protein